MTRRQLLQLGLSEDAVEYRLEIERLHRVYAGVYAVGHRPVAPHALAAAAVLACGPGAALSHGSAATLWGIAEHRHSPLEVTSPSRHRDRGLHAHDDLRPGATSTLTPMARARGSRPTETGTRTSWPRRSPPCD